VAYEQLVERNKVVRERIKKQKKLE